MLFSLHFKALSGTKEHWRWGDVALPGGKSTAWPLPKSHFSISSIKPNFMLFLPGIIRTHLFLSIQLNVLIKPLSHNIINPTTFFCTALINAILFKFYPFKVSSVIIFFTFFVHNRSIFAVLSSAYCFYRKQNYVYF